MHDNSDDFIYVECKWGESCECVADVDRLSERVEFNEYIDSTDEIGTIVEIKNRIWIHLTGEPNYSRKFTISPTHQWRTASTKAALMSSNFVTNHIAL